eukprot:EG_transcript_5987
MGKQTPSPLLPHEAAAYRRELTRLERENHRLHLEAIRSNEDWVVAEKSYKETTHRLTQELSRQQFLTGQLQCRLKAGEQTIQTLTRRWEEATAKLSRTDVAYRQRITLTDPVGPPPTPLRYDAEKRRVLPAPAAGDPDSRLLQTLQAVEDQRAALQKQNEELDERCARLQAEADTLQRRLATRDEEMERWANETSGRPLEAILAEQQSETNQLAMKSLQDQLSFLHLQLEQTEGRLDQKVAECASLAEQYETLYSQTMAALRAPTLAATPVAPEPFSPPAGPTPTAMSVSQQPPNEHHDMLQGNLLRQLTEQMQEARVKEATLLEENRQLSLSSEALRRQLQLTSRQLEEERERLTASLQLSQQQWEERRTQQEAALHAAEAAAAAAAAERDAAVARAEELQQNMNVFNEEMDKFAAAFEWMIEKQKALQALVGDLEGQLAAGQRALEAALQDRAVAEAGQAEALQRLAEGQAALEAALERWAEERSHISHGLQAESLSAELQAELARLRDALQAEQAEVATVREALRLLDEQRDVLQLQCDEQRAALRAAEQTGAATAREHAQLLSLVATLEAHGQQQGWQLRERDLQASQEQELIQQLSAEAQRGQREKEELAAQLVTATQDVAALQATHSLLTAQLEQGDREREGLKND